MSAIPVCRLAPRLNNKEWTLEDQLPTPALLLSLCISAASCSYPRVSVLQCIVPSNRVKRNSASLTWFCLFCQSQKKINKCHYPLILAASLNSLAVTCLTDFQWFIINDTATQKSCYISLYYNVPKVKQCIIQTDVNYFEMKKKILVSYE